MKELLNRTLVWKLSITRCLFYMLFVGVTDFLSATETWSGDTWHATAWFLIVRLLLKVTFCSMGGVLLAFLDQSISRGGKPPSAPDTWPPFKPNLSVSPDPTNSAGGPATALLQGKDV